MPSHILSKSARRLSYWAVLALPMGAWAQTSAAGNPDSYNSGYRRSSSDTVGGRSWMPYNRYWGFNLGAPDYEKGCASGFECSDPDLGGKVYVGGQFNKWLGAELAYVYFGRMDRNGGDTEAQGVNASLVGTLPLADAFRVFGKVGTTYGWTKVSGDVGRTGRDDGFGLSYGAGLGFDLTKTTEMVVEWDRHNFNYVGGGDSDVDMYSLGLKFRF